MKAIVVKRKLLPAESSEIANLLINSNYQLFSIFNLSKDMGNLSKPAYSIDDSIKKNINYEIFQKVNDFGDKKINDKTVAELLKYDNASIWHYHKFRIYFFVLNLYYEITELKYYSDNFDSVEYYTSNNNLKLYNDSSPKINIHYSSEKTKHKLNLCSLFNYIIYIKLKILISLFTSYNFKSRKHIIIDHSPKQTCIDIKTLNEIKGNYNLQYLFSAIDNNFMVISEEVMPKFRSSVIFKFSLLYLFRKKSYKEYPGELVFIKYYMNMKRTESYKDNETQLRLTYKAIENILSDSLEIVIMHHLRSLHKSSLYYLFRYKAYKKFFSKHKFTTLTTTDENSPVLKTIIDAAKSNKIVTLGMQHGNIHELHPAYMFTPLDKANKVMTDFTFVWGKYYRQFLADKGNYPVDSLNTVGQLRTDIIPVLQNKENINKVSGDWKPETGNKNQKLIMFASQPQRDVELRYRSAYDVFYAVKDIPDVILVVKLHPGELNDFQYYHSIARDAGCTNYKIIYYYDLYLLLSQSEIVITCFSTVGSEAVYFNKPLIVLDHLKQDIQNFYKKGVGFQALNAEQLKRYIEDILSGKLNINHQAYNDFIDSYAYKIDGKVSERCIDFIRSLK